MDSKWYEATKKEMSAPLSYFGFKKIAVFEKSGYKFGKWIGVTWFEKAISEYPKNPKPIKKVSEIDEVKLKQILEL